MDQGVLEVLMEILWLTFEEADIEDWLDSEDLGYEHFSDDQNIEHVRRVKAQM